MTYLASVWAKTGKSLYNGFLLDYSGAKKRTPPFLDVLQGEYLTLLQLFRIA